VREGPYHYGPIPMKHVYVVDAGWLWNEPPVYVGMMDPTGVVYHLNKGVSPNYTGSPGLTENWYKGLDAKSYCVSYDKLENEVTGLFHAMTNDWNKWFEENDDPTAKFDAWARQRVLDGTVKNPESWYNQKSAFVRSAQNETTGYYATLPLAVLGAKSSVVSELGESGQFGRSGSRALTEYDPRFAARQMGLDAEHFVNLPKLRQQYVTQVVSLRYKIPALRQSGLSTEQIARTLSAERRALGVLFKNRTPPAELPGIYARNMKKYGDELGPTIDYLRNVKNKSWVEIIESASTPGGTDMGY